MTEALRVFGHFVRPASIARICGPMGKNGRTIKTSQHVSGHTEPQRIAGSGRVIFNYAESCSPSSVK
eukprot:4521847-Pleurochrysis_carterae.AAC.1